MKQLFGRPSNEPFRTDRDIIDRKGSHPGTDRLKAEQVKASPESATRSVGTFVDAKTLFKSKRR